MNIELLKPVVVLAGWTLVMLVWGVALRMTVRGEVDSNVGKRMVEAGSVLPARSQFKIDNYNHLVEQPTVFYAVVFCQILMGQHSRVNQALCWAYVSLRVIHSIVHATSNPVMTRFMLFGLSSLILIWLTASTAVQIIF